MIGTCRTGIGRRVTAMKAVGIGQHCGMLDRSERDTDQPEALAQRRLNVPDPPMRIVSDEHPA
jgi:hypothetical protein